ncbi:MULTISPECIES: hypothetical protein [unclassified Streptomyces]|uniref:hypothetical protein n=1 Tax=Streptomyces sp. NPDC127532 TaxID=3345399 RepID=UPI003641C39E
MSLPRTECPEPGCGRDVAVSRKGLVYRHDPASGRTAELKSCPGSLKPVRAPEGDPVLFVAPGMPEPARLF